VKLTRWPGLTWPMSASSTDSSIFIFDRSSAMVNSSGACRLAATVWPGSMLRVRTTPLTGERITVRSRLTRVVSVEAACCRIWAWAEATWARAWSSAALARSTSLRAISWRSTRAALRW